MATFHPKVTAGALSGALVSMIVAECARRGLTIDGTEASSLTVIVSFLVGYFVPSDETEMTSGSVSVTRTLPDGGAVRVQSDTATSTDKPSDDTSVHS